MNKLVSLASSPSSAYVIIRYVTYAVQFANAMLLARCLGEYYFGVYSFIMLLTQYMSYSNLGINESLNTEYAANKGDAAAESAIWNNAWSVNLLLSAAVALACCAVFAAADGLFSAYRFDEYKYPLLASCVIANLSRVYITYYRLHGRLAKLNVQQLLPNLAVLALLLACRGRVGVNAIVWALLAGNAVSLAVFRVGVPAAPRLSLSAKWAAVLVRRGALLLLYNLSFSFLTMLASSVVSCSYSVETFGCYSFASTFVNGVVMAGGAFMFIFYPKMLNRLHAGGAEAEAVIRRVRDVYVVFMDLVSLLSVLCVIAVAAVTRYGSGLVMIYATLMLGRIINNASAGYAPPPC